MDTILIIDLHNYAWRANITFKPRKIKAPPDVWEFENPNTPKPPSDEFVMVYNFFRNLRVLIEEFRPIKIFFALEGHPQFRYDLYPEYKANRIIKTASSNADAHDRFDKNIPIIIKLLKYLPCTLVRASNYEADDTVATLAENMKDEEVIIVSNDSDYIQLLQKGFNNIKIYNPIKKEFMIAPRHFYLGWKSLNGDKADNIPSLMGDKTAQKTISDPKKLEKWLKIEENRANFNINKNLIELRKVPDQELLFEEGYTDFNTLRNEFTKMEFNSLINEKSWNKFVKTFGCIKY